MKSKWTAKGEVAVFHYWFEQETNADGGSRSRSFRRRLPQPKKFLEFGFEEDREPSKAMRFAASWNATLVLEVPDPNRDKLIKGPDALLLGAAGASLVMPVQGCKFGASASSLTFVDPSDASAGELANANTDPRRASVEIVKPKEIRQCLTRPLELDNDGNGTIQAAPAESEPAAREENGWEENGQQESEKEGSRVIKRELPSARLYSKNQYG